MNGELAKWRLGKAENTYQEGVHLFEKGFYSGAVNRFYYAAFHGMRAVLATKGLDAPKHSGVISLFNKNFVKPGHISINASKIVTRLFAERSNADYSDFAIFQRADVEKIKDDINVFLEELRCFLHL